MKDHSSMTTIEFLRSIIWKFFIGFAWYKNLLFRILPHHSTAESITILFVMAFAFFVVFSFVFRHWKNGWTATACFVLPSGIYTVLTYSTTSTALIHVTVIVACLISLVYSFLILRARIKRRDSTVRRRIYKNRLFRCTYSTSCIFTIALIVLMVGIGGHKYFGTSLISSSVKAEATSEEAGTPDTITSNMDTVLKLQPEIWAQQNTKERIDILQTICNIEVRYLGLPSPVTVEGDNLVEFMLGTYSDELRLIRINLDHIEEDPVEEVLGTLFHEIHHCYEYRLAEAYNSASLETKGLRLFKDASHYANEVDNYIDPREDYHGYMSQHLEMDSETYAELGVREYYNRIYKWLEENEQEDMEQIYIPVE